MLTDRFLYLRFCIRGANTEKMLNALRKDGIFLRRIRRQQDRSLICQCKKAHASALIRHCERFSCNATPLTPPLPTRLVSSLAAHKTFFVGALIFLFLIHLSLQHVWAIRIVDAGPYTGDIRSYLEENDIRPGIAKSLVSPEDIRRELEWRYPQAAWVKAEWRGVFLRITMVSGVPTPEVETDGVTGDVVASQDGIVTGIVTFAGTPQVKPGDFVKKGQVLILGQERIDNETTRPVKARGQVNARIWIEESVLIQAQETLTVPTGNVFSRLVFHTPFMSLSLMPEPDYTAYDLEKRSYILGGVWLPVCLTREIYEEFTLSSVLRDEAALQNEAAKAVQNLLETRLEKGDVVVDKWVDYSMIEVESYTAVAVAEVLRDIGRFSAHDGF